MLDGTRLVKGIDVMHCLRNIVSGGVSVDHTVCRTVRVLTYLSESSARVGKQLDNLPSKDSGVMD